MFELVNALSSFQFLGIPPKGEPSRDVESQDVEEDEELFPISRDPPEGGTNPECPV